MSIQRRLLVSLIAVLLAGAAATGLIVYREASEEANVLFDYQLKQVAQSLPSQAFNPLVGARPGLPEAEEGVVVQIWNLQGERLYLSHPDSKLPAKAELGFSTTRGADGDWRVYSALFQDVVIQVAQPMRVRRQIAAAVALRTVMPLLILLPVLGLLIWITVGRGMQPVRRVANEVRSRGADALEPLPELDLPDEIRPLVGEVNRLLDRLGQSLAAQRALVADAAHELRSPLTAVRLQLQLAERAATPDEVRAALSPLRDGLARAAHLVEQMLALARTEADVPGEPVTDVDLAETARAAVARFTPQAIERNIDLGLIASAPVYVRGMPDALAVLIGNLVDNSLRYTPAGGRVDVRVERAAAEVLLSVADTGPGIPAAERERVFGRFVRGSQPNGSGSGLGLAIVRNIALRHHATVGLSDNAAATSGLVVTVRFEAAAAEAGAVAPGA